MESGRGRGGGAGVGWMTGFWWGGYGGWEIMEVEQLFLHVSDWLFGSLCGSLTGSLSTLSSLISE